MRLSTGLSEEEEEEEDEVDAAGLGGISVSSSSCGWYCCCWADGVGRCENRRLWGSLSRVAAPGLLLGCACGVGEATVVLDDEFRVLPGRMGKAVLVEGPAAPATL